jgi:hypothetical protein
LKGIERSHRVDLTGFAALPVAAPAGFPEDLSPAIVVAIEKVSAQPSQ